MPLRYGSFTAWITVDGDPLPEYLVTVDADTHRVSCWIPSEEGKNFTIHWKDHGSKVDTAGYIYIDGSVASARFLFGSGVTDRDSFRVGNTRERPFVFGRVRNAGSTASSVSPPAPEIGTICLKIVPFERIHSQLAEPLSEIPDPPVGHRQTGDACILYGEERDTATQYPFTWTINPLSGTRPKSFMEFLFRYRTTDFLVMQGIMPPTAARAKSHFTSATPSSISNQSSSSSSHPPDPNSTRRVVSAPLVSATTATYPEPGVPVGAASNYWMWPNNSGILPSSSSLANWNGSQDPVHQARRVVSMQVPSTNTYEQNEETI